MSFIETFTQLIDSSYQTLSEAGLYKNPNDPSPFLKLPKDTIVKKVAGLYSESWWIVELTFNGKKEIGFIVRNTLTTFINTEPHKDQLTEENAILPPLTLEMLRTIAPNGKTILLETLIGGGHSLFMRYKIITKNRLAHFLAQICIESDGYTALEENLNYSAARLLEVFPNRISPLEAVNYAHNPKKIANKIYANRLGNGLEISGDGYKFRGRGFIQLTGRSNYREIGKLINQPLEENPDLLLTPKIALEASLGYWQMRKINSEADGSDVRAVTRKINAGLLHLAERTKLYTTLRTMLEG